MQFISKLHQGFAIGCPLVLENMNSDVIKQTKSFVELTTEHFRWDLLSIGNTLFLIKNPNTIELKRYRHVNQSLHHYCSVPNEKKKIMVPQNWGFISNPFIHWFFTKDIIIGTHSWENQMVHTAVAVWLSQQRLFIRHHSANFANHYTRNCHVGFFSPQSGIRKNIVKCPSCHLFI